MDEFKDEMEYHGFAESINDNAVNNAVDADACMQVVCRGDQSVLQGQGGAVKVVARDH